MAAVMGLRFLVNLLLLTAAGWMYAGENDMLGTVTAALAGTAYAGACLQPGLEMIQNALWRGASLAVMAWLAYADDWQKGCLYGIFDLAVHGIALGRSWELPGAALVCILGWMGTKRRILPVKITNREKTVEMKALLDTGNELRDPITGERVVIVGQKAAEALLGLGGSALTDPLATMAEGRIPGLRLIPYHGVGVEGVLLGMRFDRVRIGTRERARVVAFAPGTIGSEEYQAIVGGA